MGITQSVNYYGMSGEKQTIISINDNNIKGEKIDNICDQIFEIIKRELPKEAQTSAAMTYIVKRLQDKLEDKIVNL